MGSSNHDSRHSLISANRVEGTTVYAADGDRLGHVEEVMLDKATGKVAYALMSFGGLMGVGERYHPLPWSMLTYDVDKNGYVLPVTKAQFQGSHSLEAKDGVHNDAGWRENVHDYYSATPYWFTHPGSMT